MENKTKLSSARNVFKHFKTRHVIATIIGLVAVFLSPVKATASCDICDYGLNAINITNQFNVNIHLSLALSTASFLNPSEVSALSAPTLLLATSHLDPEQKIKRGNCHCNSTSSGTEILTHCILTTDKTNVHLHNIINDLNMDKFKNHLLGSHMLYNTSMGFNTKTVGDKIRDQITSLTLEDKCPPRQVVTADCNVFTQKHSNDKKVVGERNGIVYATSGS